MRYVGEEPATPPSFGTFDFSLSQAEEIRAARLHQEAIIIDALHQGPCGRRAFSLGMVDRLKREFAEHKDAQRAVLDTWNLPVELALRGSFPALRETWEASGITATSKQIVAMGGGSDFELCQSAFGYFSFLQQQFDRFDWLIKALVADDFRRAKAAAKRASFVNSQDTIDLGLDLGRLDHYHAFGMRMLQLTYNSVNHVGGGCTDRTDCGVTSFGARFIDRMNGLGIIVDVSHCGRATTADASRLSRRPVVASHTGCAAILDVPRNKTDDEIKRIAETGGTVGIYCVPNFLTRNERPTIEHCLDHIDYVAHLVGWQHVSIGTDWPLQAPD